MNNGADRALPTVSITTPLRRYARAVTIDELRAAIAGSLNIALDGLGSGDVDASEAEIVVERPKSREHGDYATNVAMVLAKRVQRPPREIAEALASELGGYAGIAQVDVAGPGFVNITLEAASHAEVARTVVEAGPDYGGGEALAGTKVNVEFISANPTGPLHLGHTRWAAVGDAIARVLRAAGGYVVDLAAAIVAEDPDILSLPRDDQLVAFREAAYARQLRQQQQVLDLFRTHFDVWASEQELHESAAVERGLKRLREQGHVFEEDGAVWLRTTDFGDDKDRVLVKADGEYTYFASDTAYYVDKRARGFDVNIYLLGADHHGYVNRLRAVAACAGDDMDADIEVLIGQLVKITRGGLEVKLSKRAGNIVTLEELVEEVGVDAARYTLIRYPADSPLTLDLETITRQTNDNPVFYVQYAHARISSVLRNARELGIEWREAEFDPGSLTHEREIELLGRLAEYPRIVASAAELREPHRVARYLEEMATDYHRFYDVCWVLPRGEEDVQPLHISRLWLCAAARQVLANGLDLLGVSAPERM